MRGSMVRQSSPLLAGKRLKERTRDHFPLRPDAGKARDTPRLATRIDNSHAQRFAAGAVFQMAKGVLLRIGGNCSLFTSKPAHISGHLPVGLAAAVKPKPTVRALWRENTRSNQLSREEVSSGKIVMHSNVFSTRCTCDLSDRCAKIVA